MYSFVIAALAAVTLFVTPASAADAPPAILTPVIGPSLDQWEIRFGGFAHGIGGPEKNTVDLNGEIVVPSFFGAAPLGQWSFLVPRLHAGVNGNLSRKTDIAYAGVLWTTPTWYGFFGEAFFDGAVHDGLLSAAPGMAAMGCRAAYHVGQSTGYRFDQRWSIMFTFDHVSNGLSMGLSNCPNNTGLNNYGARIGLAF